MSAVIGSLTRSFVRSVTVAAAVLAVAAAVLAVALAWGVQVVQGHGELERSEPTPDSVLAAAPARVRLWFNEPLEPLFSEAVVYGEGGARADAADSAISDEEPRLLEVTLRRRTTGRFTVEWRALAKIDGHLSSGSFQFQVGSLAREPGGSSAALSAPSNITLASVASKWLGLGAGFLLVGGAVFWVFALRPTFRAGGWRGSQVVDLLKKRLLLLVALASLALLAALGLDLLAQSRWPAGPSDGGGITGAVLGTNYGRLWLLKLALGVLLVALVVSFSYISRRRATRLTLAPAQGTPLSPSPGYLGLSSVIVVVTGAALLASYSATSHLAAFQGLPGFFLDLAHLLAAAVWLGGLGVLIVVALPCLSGLPIEARGAAFGHLVQRFSGLAIMAVGVALLTGVVGAVLQLETLSDLTGSTYGMVLLVKLALLLPLLFLGLLQLSGPRHLLAVVTTSAGGLRAVSRLRLLGGSELAVAGAIVVVSVVLSLTSPGGARQAAAAESFSGTKPLHFAQTVDWVQVTLDLDPRKFLVDRLLVTLKEVDDGPPVETATVTYRTSSLDADLGVLSGPASPLGQGRYEAGGLPNRPGKWKVEVLIAAPGKPPVEAPFVLDLGPDRFDLFLTPRAPASNPEAARLLAETAAGMRRLQTLRFDQVVDDGSGKLAIRVFAILEEPDGLYLRAGGAEFIRIGTVWYSNSGHGWLKEQGPAPRGPSGYWSWLDNAQGVQFVGREQWKGQDTAIVSFLQPGLPAKFWEWIEPSSGRIVREVMVAVGHYMITDFHGFDLPLSIEPPLEEGS